FWTPQGDIIDAAGRHLSARALIDEEAENAKETSRPRAKVAVRSIRFVTPDVAIEDGTSQVTSADAKSPPMYGRFTATWVKHQGKWRLASLREARVDPPSGTAALAELAWMVGEWTAKNGEVTVEVSTHWNSTHTFLIRGLKFIKEGQVVFSGLQRISWDPATQSIKSLTFDSEGGRSEGRWTKNGNSWNVEAAGLLPTGRRSTSVNSYTPEGPDSFTWKSATQHADGELVPALELRLLRKPATK
ncbi:MAG TPA: DUF4440 domain-containing protein, partial [Pirellulales bacterium]|nr:DUF4440 domain-containing protein [Pirellulales bacterium]